MSSPAIIHTVKFVESGNKKFKSYIDYIDREEATRSYKFKDYSLYNDYMGNPEKSGNLFTQSNNFLTKEQKLQLKEKFVLAQRAKSLMWQDVFSFDNKFLEKMGLYDSNNKILNEDLIREAVRNSMKTLQEKEKMSPSFLWSASIHYNTDNIHIHVASVEVNPTRENWERGKRKPRTLFEMKGKFTNTIMKNMEDYTKINDIIRKDIVHDKKNYSSLKNLEMKKLFMDTINNLPADRRQWYYKYNTMNSARPYLDRLTEYYLKNYKNKEYKELVKKLDQQELVFKELYGEGKSKKYKNYKVNKLNELYSKMGNQTLNEIRDLIKKEEQIKKESKKSFTKSRKILITSSDINRLRQGFNKTIDNIKNQREYEKLQKEIEYQNLSNDYDINY